MPGTGIEAVPNITEVSGTEFRVRNEPYRSLRQVVEVVPNFPKGFGRVFTEQYPPGILWYV